MEDNNIKLTFFEIRGLFNRKDVRLNFNNHENVDIFIGQNGIGKTTILNIIYNTLSLKFLELRKMPFYSIKVGISNGSIVDILREELFTGEGIPRKISKGALNDIEQYLGFEYVRKLNRVIDNSDYIEAIDYLDELSNISTIPNRLKRYLNNIVSDNEITSSAKSLKELIEKLQIEEIFFFPTYRRIEEDIKKFSIEHENLNKLPGDIIQFGMSDVEEKFNQIERVISRAISDTYANLTGDMISYLSLNKGISDERKKKIENTETVEIILSRLANKIDAEVKINVTNLFKDKSKIYLKEYEPLVFFLCALIDKYEENMYMEDKIHEFKNVVNKYLINKSIVYDAHNIQIYVIDDETYERIPLTVLSSGEKQIISLYSKIYLSFYNNYIVLFDEPELSLSIEWQETLIADIMDSNKCKFLMAVTHSPFIYNNQFEESARSMELFIESKASSVTNIEEEDDYAE